MRTTGQERTECPKCGGSGVLEDDEGREYACDCPRRGAYEPAVPMPVSSHTNVKAKPNCYECKFRRDLAGDCHSTCANKEAKVTGNAHGIRHGWFFWPYNFDPTWLVSCDGFAAIKTPLTDDLRSTP